MLRPDYTKAILRAYHQKKAAGAIPFDMKQLSSASFKAACLEVCRERYERKDEALLKAFFEKGNDQDTFLKAIDEFKNDRFKPLVNFIKERTSSPDDKVVEIVAWMIDFEKRPYDPTTDYSKIAGDIPALPIDVEITVRPEPNEKKDPAETKAVEPVKKNQKGKTIILSITVLVTLGMVTYLLWPTKPTKPDKLGKPAPVTYTTTGPQACMYWSNDHYQPVSCNQKIENAEVIPLDTEKVVHLRKITRPDTITYNAIGHVWYVKYQGNIEFYTSDGFHPIDTTLRMKHITRYIIDKYIHKENIPNEGGQ